MGESQRSGSLVSLRWFFLLFFFSGFCSLLYEVVWLRLAMAKFGVTSALLSIVLSMFMGGLGLGSWISGRIVRNRQWSASLPFRFYAATELAIGLSALVVPLELSAGRALIAHWAQSSSAGYYLASAFVIGSTLIPWCSCMGATIPFAMQTIRNSVPADAQRSFSYLYLANVAGAFWGALIPLLLIEAYGFRSTLKFGALLNGALALIAMLLSARSGVLEPSPANLIISPSNGSSTRSLPILALLFATGCTSMGLEVVWTRQFTPYVGTVVYAFSSLLALYLISTFLGSRLYRRWSRQARSISPVVWAFLGLTALLSGVTADPGLHLSRLLRLLIGIVPFSGLLGFVTPMLVDRFSSGDPDRAGTAYAWNVLGCIVGPLLAGFVLLPSLSERCVLLVFAAPWLALGLIPQSSPKVQLSNRKERTDQLLAYATVVAAVVAAFGSKGYESKFAHPVVMRDATATIIAMGEGRDKHLLVNGVGITSMTPITKMMAHLPLAFVNHPPQNALAICFGMGTSYRSLLSWNIDTTAVELVPSVPKVFWYFHPDAQELLRSPLSHIVIDDGRNYLERNEQQFDVITIDPPPPIEAAGSSLLYSAEFYRLIATRLRPGGILQQWVPRADAAVRASTARALTQSFNYVRVFGSVEGWGFHFLASNQPFADRTAEELAARLPEAASHDLTAWGPESSAEADFEIVLNREVTIGQVIAEDPTVTVLADDRPINEFYGLRRYVRPQLRRLWASIRGQKRVNSPQLSQAPVTPK